MKSCSETPNILGLVWPKKVHAWQRFIIVLIFEEMSRRCIDILYDIQLSRGSITFLALFINSLSKVRDPELYSRSDIFILSLMVDSLNHISVNDI